MSRIHPPFSHGIVNKGFRCNFHAQGKLASQPVKRLKLWKNSFRDALPRPAKAGGAARRHAHFHSSRTPPALVPLKVD